MKERRDGPPLHTTFRTTPEDQALLEALHEHLGIGKTDVLRVALRKLARAERIAIPRAGRRQAPAPPGGFAGV